MATKKKVLTAARVLGDKKRTPSGREVWRLTSSGKTFDLTTSSSSTAAMDVAVRTYSSALKRLAKR